jgi:hypothetical protein
LHGGPAQPQGGGNLANGEAVMGEAVHLKDGVPSILSLGALLNSLQSQR